MPSLIDSICNRIQSAATPHLPPPMGGVPASAVTSAPPSRVQQVISGVSGDTQLPHDLFKSMLDAEDRAPEKSRKGRPGFLHVSSLIGMCARAQVLSVLHGVEVHEAVTGQHRVMWKFGRAVEAHVRDTVIRAKNYADVYGVWKCVCGRTEETGFFNRTRICNTCKGKLDVYGELTLYDQEAGIVGNPDLLMRHNGPFVIKEIKSITGDDWNKLEAPLGDHVFQAAMYHHLMKKNGHPVYDEVVIFYTSKHFTKWGSPYKEFHVNVATPHIQQQVTDAVALALSVKVGNAQRAAPPRTVCTVETCTRAKNCPAMNLCFRLP